MSSCSPSFPSKQILSFKYLGYSLQIKKYFKTTKTEEFEAERSSKTGEISPDIYYMKQTVSNACGTVALVHAIANNRDKIELGDDGFLAKFLDDTKNDSPEVRAEKLEKNEELSQAHDEVAHQGQTQVIF